MDYILDTHVFLWTVFDSKKLSEVSKNILLDSRHRKFISISTMWEIAIKNRVGKLTIPHSISNVFNQAEMNGFGIIEINQKCIEIYNTLPLIHRDPFDGIIIATAMLGKMTIITADETIKKYDVNCVW